MLIHPAIVHFPIALFTSTAIFVLLSLFVKKELFKEIVFWNLLLGVVTAIAAVLTGLFAEQNIIHNEEVHEILQKHKYNGFAIVIVFLSLLIWLWIRKNRFGEKEYILWITFLLLGCLMTFYQGFLGGEMVFQHGAGVKPMELILEMEGNKKDSHSNNKSDSTTSHHQDSTASDMSSHKTHQPEKSKSEENTSHVHNADSAPSSTKTHPHEQNKSDAKMPIKMDSTKKENPKKELKDMKY